MICLKWKSATFTPNRIELCPSISMDLKTAEVTTLDTSGVAFDVKIPVKPPPMDGLQMCLDFPGNCFENSFPNKKNSGSFGLCI